MTRRQQALALAAERDVLAADSRREAERCAVRHDDAGVAIWTEKAAKFAKSAEFWRECAMTWRPDPVGESIKRVTRDHQELIRDLAGELREEKGR